MTNTKTTDRIENLKRLIAQEERVEREHGLEGVDLAVLEYYRAKLAHLEACLAADAEIEETLEFPADGSPAKAYAAYELKMDAIYNRVARPAWEALSALTSGQRQ